MPSLLHPVLGGQTPQSVSQELQVSELSQMPSPQTGPDAEQSSAQLIAVSGPLQTLSPQNGLAAWLGTAITAPANKARNTRDFMGFYSSP
jgi:hypothetical protein